VWYEYRPDCVDGRIIIETEDPRDIVVYADSSAAPELLCETDTTRVELDARRIRIRVAGGVLTRIRASCIPSASPLAEASVCRNAEPITDGTLQFDIWPGTTDGVSLVPGDSCAMDTEFDRWYRYDASCTGRARIAARFGRDSVEFGDCLVFAEADAVLSVYDADVTCPERDHPLSCLPVTTPICQQSEPVTAEIPVVLGERLFLRVGRTSPLSFTSLAGELSVECVDDDEDCAAHCVARSPSCDINEDEVTCDCRPGWVGDGKPESRGGSSCVLDGPCSDRGFDCTNGRCVYNDSALGVCACDSGYIFAGGRCVQINDCDWRFGDGYAECEAGTHSRCLELDEGYTCACDAGRSPIPGSDPFDCALVCGDGIHGPGESCDDGNTTPGDGCDGRCATERGYRCYEATGGRSECYETCGDGWIDLEWEQCDDGNREPGDGCDSSCQLEVAPPRRFCASRLSPTGDSTVSWLSGLLLFGLLVGSRRRRSSTPGA
jgi:cysteine-rich repeat protein